MPPDPVPAPRWALVVGRSGAERSEALLDVAERMRRAGLRVGGFVQRPVASATAGPDGREVVRFGTGARIAVGRPGAEARAPHEEAFCGFVFDRDAFARARAWIEEDAPAADVVLVDEVSKLEVAGRGHHDAVAWALRRAADAGRGVVVLGVRADQLFYVVERFGLGGDAVAQLDAPADGAARDAFARDVERAYRR